MITVAALYIDPRGPYPKIAGVECWDVARDATKYDGPWPIVAHPPCGPWGRLRHLARKDDPALAIRAVAQVRKWGGILEHPEQSLLFRHCGMPRPGELPDEYGGRSIEVCQCDWGHVARKRTWLYLVGITKIPACPPPREPTHWISGGRGRAGKKMKTTPIPPGIKACSAAQRRRTPPDFAAWLVDLAASELACAWQENRDAWIDAARSSLRLVPKDAVAGEWIDGVKGIRSPNRTDDPYFWRYSVVVRATDLLSLVHGAKLVRIDAKEGL